MLSEGRWTHNYPIDFEQANGMGLPVRDQMPKKVKQLKELCPQAQQQRPGYLNSVSDSCGTRQGRVSRAHKLDQDIIEFKENEKGLLFQILKALRSIRYGYVQITVQDSKVVQIDKMEKTRFDKTDSYILKEEWGI